MKYCIILLTILSLVLVQASSYGEIISTDNYEISRSIINRTLNVGNLFEDSIGIENKENRPMLVSFSVFGDASSAISFDSSELIIEPKSSSTWDFKVVAIEEGIFTGELSIAGDVIQQIPISINATKSLLNTPLLIDINLPKKNIYVNRPLSFKVDITKLKPIPIENLTLSYLLIDQENNTIPLGEETLNVENSTQMLKKFDLPGGIENGYHTLQVLTTYDDKTIYSESLFVISTPFLATNLFGFLPVWLLLAIIGFLLSSVLAAYLVKRHIDSKKKYKMFLDMKSLPKKDKSFLWFGKIAEKKNMAYLDPHKLTTHAIVAGSTGGGKSIAAQVIIEEALKQNICVIVFDPTAQWSGMLRKCEDKKMFSYYPNFGMKKTDARGFPGNIRAVKDARQIIDIEKHFEPGHIQIFTLNKLQPKDMDIFISNIIRQIFKSDPKEYPTLRTLLVFDEIHRILPKFGGSGEGFVQIERSCREFRKWGYGVMLISQVLSDFAGQIKANISTEVQMRTRDEGDLNRIKTKYGEDFLQSLVKASVGVGMFVNPAYNHANPYFINFRPILHNTRRLTDEELEQYNQYNDRVEDLDYQIEQLEEEKIDVFDLKMELKLVKDKIMVGNFSVVDIYLEGLTPRLAKQWEKIGKKPKKKEIELADLDEIKKSVEEAKQESKKAKAKEAKEEKTKEEEKKDPMEELNNKLLNPVTLDNGVMISSLKELKNVLPNLDDDIFKTHVNKEKNDIATWFEQLSKTYGARLKSVIDKAELIKEIEAFKGDTKPEPEAKPKGEPKEKPSEESKTKPKLKPQLKEQESKPKEEDSEEVKK